MQTNLCNSCMHFINKYQKEISIHKDQVYLMLLEEQNGMLNSKTRYC